MNNSKGMDRKTIVAYVQKFLHEDYRQSNVFLQLSEDKSTEDIMALLREDLKMRYPLSACHMKLFHMERHDNEEIHQLCSAEAEIYATAKVGSKAIGFRAMLLDLGMEGQ